jgi:hypothetical protein
VQLHTAAATQTAWTEEQPLCEKMHSALLELSHCPEVGWSNISGQQVAHEVRSPEIAEALVVWRAVTLAHDEGLDGIILMWDCLSVIQWIRSKSRDQSLVGVVVDDIKSLATSFSFMTFRHVSRLCNNSHT